MDIFLLKAFGHAVAEALRWASHRGAELRARAAKHVRSLRIPDGRTVVASDPRQPATCYAKLALMLRLQAKMTLAAASASGVGLAVARLAAYPHRRGQPS